MSAAGIVEQAALEGVELRLVDGELRVRGERAARERWLPAIRERKAEIVELLAAKAASDTGPRLGDLPLDGREAGWRIYRALCSLKVEPSARPP